MSTEGNGNQNPQSAKVVKLGLNISVTGDPGTDVKIILDENKSKSVQSSLKNEIQSQTSDPLDLEEGDSSLSKNELERGSAEDNLNTRSTGAIPKWRRKDKNMNPSASPTLSEAEKEENNDSSIIDRIKTTMEHFEKFSDHIKEIPRLRNHPIATSTPFSNKQNSKSESSLVHSDYRPGKFAHLYEFQTRRNYFKSSIKPLPPDLFLKPLPGENLYRRGMYSRYFDLEPYRHYGSDNSLNRTADYRSICANPKDDFDRYETCNLPTDQPSGILKKSDSESGDKHSTSSADSIKDIKIYQSGGILIMQNFKDGLDPVEKKEMSDFSVKLIEKCNKLKDEVSSFRLDKALLESSCEENKNSGKTVQFDLTNADGEKSGSADQSCVAVRDENSFIRLESSESTSDCPKTKDTSPQGTSQSQDFPSLSTQENDSMVSNQPGTSPTFVSPKKLEWDSGADIGYMNLDLTKENLSTIERIVLKGLSSDGLREKNVVYEKTPELNQRSRSKFILERIPSDLVIEEVGNGKKSRESAAKVEGSSKESETENHHVQGGNEGKKAKEKTEKKSGGGAWKEASKGENRSAEPKPSLESTRTDKSDKVAVKGKRTTDKSVNVNTLWDDARCETSLGQQSTGTESSRQVDHPTKGRSRRISPKVRKVKKKRSSVQRAVPAKDKTDSPIERRSKSCTDASHEMGVSEKSYKNVGALPVANDAELSREVEEIIVDQRYKNNEKEEGKPVEKATALETPAGEGGESKADGKAKSRPISASSGSNKTVLPKAMEEEASAAEENKFVSQLVQTNDFECESVGIQAFASQVSSDCDGRSYRRRREETKGGRQSSKNIQAFGLNASLPKQLEHRKESKESIADQNTKSTQFFGGPVNSLPNYHSNLVVKPGETCGRAAQVLKAKKNLEAEIIRLKEENEKNILANDGPPPRDAKPDSRKRTSKENKENLIKKSSNSSRKKSQSNSSRKTSKGSGSQESERKEKEGGKEKGKAREGSEDVHTSDEVSSLVLTSEVLKVHGDSIDRNIIQEKYFQSQLAEYQLRKMITRSTSMELETAGGGERNGCKEYTSTGCQYSPQSKDANQENDSSKGKGRSEARGTSEQYDSSQNVAEDCFETLKSTANQGQGQGAGDSLPSSTQTAHSWVPGMRNPGENVSGVGRARSFEYLPGDIYESSGNLREELPSETEQNLITSGSSDSDTAKRSPSDRGRESEGRNTLVLENSTESSHDSDRLKVLDWNLTRLSVAVLKLQDKDARVQSVTRSLLANLWKGNGSGDGTALERADGSRTEGPNNVSSSGKECGDTTSEPSGGGQRRRGGKEKEMSIACQTEERSSSSEPGKFYEERKALEKRISDEKECQIKWIENEIHHLNVLRGLLEKQNSGRLRKKKSSTTTSNEGSKREVESPLPAEVHHRPVTPVYGCRITVRENGPQQEPETQARDRRQGHWCQGPSEEPQQYGVAVSLPRKDQLQQWRQLLMVPVDVQVSLKDRDFAEERGFEERNEEGAPQFYGPEDAGPGYNPRGYGGVAQVDVNTQCPSERRASGNHPSISVQTSFSPPGRCAQCNEETCVCLSLEKSYSSLSRSSKSRTSERRGSSKLTSLSEEPELENENRNDIQREPTDPVGENCKNYNEDAPDSFGTRSRPKSGHGANCKCPGIGQTKPDLPESCEKGALSKNPDCRCENCLVPVSSSVSRSECRCGQSNIYLNIDKSAADLGFCRCCESQAQKTAKSPCHIIKIHGAKCCSSGKCSCCCKNRSKKTEDQSCQTEPDEVRPENVSNGRRNHPEQCPCCGCGGTGAKEKTRKVDDHPRHYFLKIEETEVDEDSKEPEPEQRKSLEVITVTVPVKKVGKARAHRNKIRESSGGYQEGGNFPEFPPGGCNCCSECIAHRWASAEENEARAKERTRSVAEKPESPRRDRGPLLKEGGRRSHDSANYGGVGCPPNEPGREVSSREYCAGKSVGFEQRELYNVSRRASGSEQSQSCDGCKCMRRNGLGGNAEEFPREYNSHKKSRGGYARERYQEGRRYEGAGSWENGQVAVEDSSGGRNTQGWRSQPRKSQAPEMEARCSYDYYNYNRPEFMTKSELLKEEEQRQKVHQPSLQEYLTSNRPDFYSSAERRRQIISERAKERVKKHGNRMECLIDLIHRCNEHERVSSGGPKRMFTTVEMREQTMKRYRKLSEVTGKLADRKKKEEYRTNKLMADIFAKKLQSEALKGHLNLSNSVALLRTI